MSDLELKANNETPLKGELIEGLHYNLEQGLFVFTSFYLRLRGYCCNNNCKNCPYKLKEE